MVGKNFGKDINYKIIFDLDFYNYYLFRWKVRHNMEGVPHVILSWNTISFTCSQWLNREIGNIRLDKDY